MADSCMHGEPTTGEQRPSICYFYSSGFSTRRACCAQSTRMNRLSMTSLGGSSMRMTAPSCTKLCRWVSRVE